MKRKLNARQIKPRFIIVCGADKTEPLYFEGAVRRACIAGRLAVVKVLRAKKKDPINAVNAARRCKEFDKDIVWVVLDKDDFSGHLGAEMLADRGGIKIALSCVCFELWVLMHYCYTTRSFPCCGDLIKELQRYIPEYAKNDEGLFDMLEPMLPTAMEHARRLRGHNLDVYASKCRHELDCYTDVDMLLADLVSFKEKIQEKM